MSVILKKDGIRNILYGATFLGAGGGGALEDGLRLLEEVSEYKEIRLGMFEPSEMVENEYAVSVAG